ncbi:MAG: hypothetical protein LBI86_06535 [Treponema sp.]|jgi:hypothetical protein|nr:hypothetical protein [Treponema sp.]
MKRRHITLTGIAALTLVFITMLFAGCFTLGGSGSGSTGDGSTAAPVQYVSDGAYTFYPRLQATKAGVEMDEVYLDRIEAKGGTVTIYLSNTPLVKGGGPAGGNWVNSRNSSVLQDLDQPGRSYSPVNSGEDSVIGGVFLTFQGVRASTRFSLAHDYYDPPVVFEEIVLGEPDVPLNLPPLKNGTYTFSPRPQATVAGVETDAYIDRIVIRSGYFTVYLVNKAMGKGGTYGIGGNWGNSLRSSVLQNLDYPQLRYNPVNSGEDSVSGGLFITFEGVTAARFNLSHYYYNPPIVFDEITLGEPDA